MKYCLLLLLLLLSSGLKAITRYVPGTYPTIQAALNACVYGDSVVVAPGTYNETITWPNTGAIKLAGTGGSAVTSINATAGNRVMYINATAIDTNTVIQGFTITGGLLSTGFGAGMHVYNCSVKLDDVNITNNRINYAGGWGYGAGLYLYNSSSVIWNSSISGNAIDTATWCYGAGVHIDGGAPVFTNVTIANNSMRAENWCYGVGMYVTGSDVGLYQVKVTGNISGDNAIWYYGNGIYMNETTADLFNVLVAENRSGIGGSFNYGGGIYFDGAGSNIFMMNCTVTGNTKTNNGTITGSGVFARDAAVSIVNGILFNLNTGLEFTSSGTSVIGAVFSNVRGGASGVGNINIIPGFVSANDFHLLPTSPCAGTGTDNGAPSIDLDGSPRPVPTGTFTDMGCYEVDQSQTGLAETEAAPFTAFPNPIKSGEVLTVLNAGEWIIVTDIAGRVICERSNNTPELQLSTSNWKQGYYFIRSENSKVIKVCVM